METNVLHVARRELKSAMPWPLRILAVDRMSASALVFLIEGSDRARRQRLVLDIEPAHSTLHLAPAGRELEEGASGGFLGSLAGSFFADIEPSSDPRALRLRLETSLGERRSLLCEWTGRRGNLTLLDSDDVVIDALKRGDSGDRALAREADPRPSPAEIDALELTLKSADLPSERWPRELARALRGVSVIEAMLALADALAENPTPEHAIPRALASLANTSTPGLDASPTARELGVSLYLFPRRAEVEWPGRKGVTAEKLGLPAAVVRAEPSSRLARFAAPDADVFALMARAHAANVDRTNEEARRANLLRVVAADMKKLVRLRENLLAERGAPGEGALLRKSGEAILAHFGQIERGQSELVAPDWAGGEDAPPLRIVLDPARSVKDNAESYFRRARRWERGEPHRKKRLELIDQSAIKLSRVESRVKDSEGAPSESAVESWRRDALGSMWKPAFRATQTAASRDSSEQPATSSRTRAGRKASPDAAAAQRHPKDRRESFRPRAFTTRDGWTVWVGRSNKENDHVTHVLAHPEDFWFHAHGVPGSHVVLRREGRKDNPSAKTLEEAAAIAAFFSKARHAGKVPVIYTLKKYVRKPRKAPAGLAMVEREKMIMIAPRNPDEGKAPEWSEE